MTRFTRTAVVLVTALLVSAGLVGLAMNSPARGAADDAKKGTKTASTANQPRSINDLLTARLKLAENGYSAVLEALSLTRRQGNVLVYVGQPERAYDWSLRWLQAEQDLADGKASKIAALESHLKRMTEVEDKVEQLSRDLLPKAAVMDAEWHRLDAELRLAQARDKRS